MLFSGGTADAMKTSSLPFGKTSQGREDRGDKFSGS
jgi:hypothetical protein